MALCGFAGNSLLTRVAIERGLIDPLSFAAIRLGSGALLLLMLMRGPRNLTGSTAGAAALLGYTLLFSWAYRSLTAATGALLLFAAVQATMVAGAILRGEQPSWLQWLGLFIAATGLVLLLLPGLQAPPPLPAALMLGAGLCWGTYSLLGVSSNSPLASTAGNFLRAGLVCVPVVLLAPVARHLTLDGVAFAITSGAVTSAVAYAVWYRVLPALGSFRGAVAQLAVPALTALAAMVLLTESISLRFVAAEALITAGIAVSLAARRGRAGGAAR